MAYTKPTFIVKAHFISDEGRSFEEKLVYVGTNSIEAWAAFDSINLLVEFGGHQIESLNRRLSSGESYSAYEESGVNGIGEVAKLIYKWES